MPILFYILGGIAGWYSDWSLMASLGHDGFWLGLLGFVLCLLTIAAAISISATVMGAIYGQGFGPSSLILSIQGFANGFSFVAAVAVGYFIGAEAVVWVWLGVLLAILSVALVVPVLGNSTNRSVASAYR